MVADFTTTLISWLLVIGLIAVIIGWMADRVEKTKKEWDKAQGKGKKDGK